MKSVHSFILLLLVTMFVFSSCKSEIEDMGVSIQPDGDKITVKTFVSPLITENYFIDSILSRPDSFLLGTYKDKKYGTTHADILAQFRFPFKESDGTASDDFRFPDNAVVDSLILGLSYRSFTGKENSTMAATIYRMNQGEAFNYSDFYPSNIDPNEYVDFNQTGVKLGERVFTAKDATGTKDSTRINIMLSEQIRNEMFDILKDKAITNQDKFQQRFNGMYITSAFGDATMMNIRNRGINAYLYYHYDTKIEGRDTTFVNAITIPANNEVTQVNRFQHPDAAQIKAYLDANDSINYISSPANIYTRVKIPLRNIVKNLQDSVSGKQLIVNSAIIRVNAKDVKGSLNIKEQESDPDMPIPTHMLLIPEENMFDFFKRNNSVPADDIIHSDYYSNDTTHVYAFNIARLVTNEITKASQDTENLPEQLNMLLVPVGITVTYDTNGNRTITGIKQQTQLTGVTIRSGSNPTKPMTLDVVCSGF